MGEVGTELKDKERLKFHSRHCGYEDFGEKNSDHSYPWTPIPKLASCVNTQLTTKQVIYLTLYHNN